MSLIQGFLLGILQGVAEFLPISSSGHLRVAQKLFKLGEVPLLFDVFLHIATLLAVVIYFREIIWTLVCVFFRMILGRNRSVQTFDIANVHGYDNKVASLAPNDKAGRHTILMIVLTTLVTGILGYVSSRFLKDLPDKAVFVGFLVTAAFLVFSAVVSKKIHGDIEPDSDSTNDLYITRDSSVTWIQALVIGIAQGIGTLPGISRSGSTISGAALSGVDRKTAGDYSFIVSIPAILGAFVLTLKDALDVAAERGESFSTHFSATVGILPALVGFASAFVFGYVALTFLMRVIHKGKLEWFAIYLVPAGILGLIFL